MVHATLGSATPSEPVALGSRSLGQPAGSAQARARRPVGVGVNSGLQCGSSWGEQRVAEFITVRLRLGSGFTVRHSAVGVGGNGASQCGWGWG